MFTSASFLKRELKKAYKAAGVRIFNCYNGYFIEPESQRWTLFVEREHFSKKQKAAVIEVVGELPETNEAVLYHCNGDQIEMQDADEYFKIIGYCKNATLEYNRTCVSIEGYCVLQNKESNHKKLIDASFMDANSIKNVEENENGPKGPAFMCETSAPAAWTNEHEVFIAYTINPEYMQENARNAFGVIIETNLN